MFTAGYTSLLSVLFKISPDRSIFGYDEIPVETSHGSRYDFVPDHDIRTVFL